MVGINGEILHEVETMRLLTKNGGIELQTGAILLARVILEPLQ